MNKQLIFMIIVTLIGAGGSLLVSPFYGVAVYYLFAVLRPQFIWQWSLPEGVSWSFYVAIAAIIGFAFNARSKGTPPDPEGGWRLSAAHWAVFAFGAWVSLTYFTAQIKLSHIHIGLSTSSCFSCSGWQRGWCAPSGRSGCSTY